MDTPNWFHVFDADSKLWLQDDNCSWGGYFGAAEFATYELAHEAALRELKSNPDSYDTVVVLGDFGQVLS